MENLKSDTLPTLEKGDKTDRKKLYFRQYYLNKADHIKTAAAKYYYTNRLGLSVDIAEKMAQMVEEKRDFKRQLMLKT